MGLIFELLITASSAGQERFVRLLALQFASERHYP